MWLTLPAWARTYIAAMEKALGAAYTGPPERHIPDNRA